MNTYIKKLQSKSKDTRKQILIGALVISMSFVVLIWISSLGYKFNKESSAKVQEDIKPFALFKQTISNTYNNVTASAGNISSLKKKEVKKVEEVKTEKQIDLIPVEYSN